VFTTAIREVRQPRFRPEGARRRHRRLDGLGGDCYDNAVAETFFATLKKELVHRRSWPTRRELACEVFEYIEAFYNRRRRHSTLGYLSPADYEEVPDQPWRGAALGERHLQRVSDELGAHVIGPSTSRRSGG
jgi:hypothetical protein